MESVVVRNINRKGVCRDRENTIGATDGMVIDGRKSMSKPASRHQGPDGGAPNHEE